MSNIENILAQHLRSAICSALGEELADIDPLLSVASNPRFGDYQANLAMSLGKKLSRPPRDIATDIVAELNTVSVFKKAEVAGPGFINLQLSTDFVNQQLQEMAADEHSGLSKVDNGDTVVLDYSAPNVAKEMHVGHLRSTLIGDAIARILSSLGHKVIRQNHLGDWGTQFGMLIENMVESGWELADSQHSLRDLNQLYQESKRKFDTDQAFAQRARERVVALQSGDEKSKGYWQALIDESRKHFNQIYHQLGVLLEDSDICAESFYNPVLPEVIDELKDAGILEQSQGASVVFPEGFKDRDDQPLPMIVQKQDGGYLYATTDLAAARYRVNQLKANRLIYVIDARQSLHLAMVFATLSKTGWVDESIRLEHVAFGTVLGADRKPFKTREGGTVRLIDLLEEAVLRAEKVIADKNPELSIEQRGEIARVVGIGALKYADLSSERIKDYVFDWDRMLALDGNTAPYLQNAYVRIRSIFRKGNIDAESITAKSISVSEAAEHALALKLFRFVPTVESAAEKLEPSRLCTYLYDLASAFHSFYEQCPVLKEGVAEPVRNSRLTLCDVTAKVLRSGLGLLGIETVEQM